jgi:hypothetical protein
MTMSLVGPWLSTTGKRRGKHKFRNAEAAAKARMNEESWKELQKRWGIEEEDRKRDRALKAKPYEPPPQPYRRDTGPRHASKPDTRGVAVRAPDKVYTGDAMIGIGQLHKSNAIPIFQAEDAVDISKMRRG